MDLLPIKRAILSVTDKTNLVEFASFLLEAKVELFSTGGTFKTLRDAGLLVKSISDITEFPEILGGRVKTLHPKIHGGILANKDNPEHIQTLSTYNIESFDLVCVNLYNFSKAVKKDLEITQVIEEIDIGGPCMLRAAAKNFHSVAVIPAISWYDRIKEEMKNNSMNISLELRKQLAAATFSITSEYDSMIATYLNNK